MSSSSDYDITSEDAIKINCKILANCEDSESSYYDVTSEDLIKIKCKKYTKCEDSESSYIYEEDDCHKPCKILEPCRVINKVNVKKRKNFNNPDVCSFRSLITPLSALTPLSSKTPGPIEFRMRRKNKVVSLQWEPFSGIITTTGIAYLMLAQTIANLPPYPVFGVYNIEYNGVRRVCAIEVNPAMVQSNVLFYLNTDGSTTGVNANDSIVVRSAVISWIVD